MLNTDFSPWPSFTPEEAKAVSKVLLSNKVNYWTGNECRQFEKEFAIFSDSEFAIAVANGTLAIDLALLALDIGGGDEVIVTSRTFLASVSCIVNAGAIPVFADVDVNSQNITAETISKVLTPNTKAIICVHLAGWPCDMDPILELAKIHNLFVIEDCAQAHGATYKGQSVGALGDISAWSFCQDKIMTTGGEGGMVTTNNEQLWQKMWAYKDHGKSYMSVYEKEHPPGFRWVHDSFGSNFRMTEMQASIGRIQLLRMPDWFASRNNNAMKIISTCLKYKCFRIPKVPAKYQHSYYKLYIFVDPKNIQKGWNRDKIVHELNHLGIPCYQGSCSEVYLEKAFDNTKFRPKIRLPVAQALGETSLMFLVHPTLTEKEINRTCNTIDKVAQMILSTN